MANTPQTDPPVNVGPVAPAPIDMTVTVRTLPYPDGHKVCLTVATAQGLTAFFFPPEQAEAIAKELQRQARIAATGLVVPDTNRKPTWR